MSSTLTATCPTCKAPISDDARSCMRCGAEVSVWPDTGPAPLILPGSPAFSADLFRRRPTSTWVIGGSLAAVAVVLGALYVSADDDDPRDDPPVAIAAAVESPERRLSDDAPLPAAVVDAPADEPAQPIAIEAAPVVLPPIPATVPTAPAPVPAPAATVPTREPTPRAVATAPITATATGAAAAAAAKTSPVLRMVPLISDTLRPGELLRLRWFVQDRVTRRTLPARVEFTSTNAAVATVDSRNGTVTAHTPGRVSIIADGGTAGTTTLDLIVRTPAPVARPAVVATTAEPLQERSEAARSTTVSTPPPVVRAPTPAPSTPAPAAAVREARRDMLPNDDDVRSAVERLVSEVRRGGSRTFELIQFYADGDAHRVALVRAPSTISTMGTSVRVAFELRLTKYDGGGRPISRLASVAMNVDKRDGTVSSSAIAISALRKP